MKNVVRIGIANPEIKLGAPELNAALFAEIAREAEAEKAQILLFPRLALTGATLGDLYKNRLLLSSAEKALADYVRLTSSLEVVSIVGAPLSSGGEVLDCAAVIAKGEICAVIPADKADGSFSPPPVGINKINIFGKDVPVLCGALDLCGYKASVTVGESEPRASADIALFLGALPETLSTERTLADLLCRVSCSVSPVAAYAGAGAGESGTDFVFSGRGLVFAAGEKILGTEPFSSKRLSVADCEIKGSFCAKCERVAPEFEFSESGDVTVVPHLSPFIPKDGREQAKACELALEIQAQALAKRVVRSYSKKVILGISGGLDSTLALLVAARAMDILDKPHSDIIAVTMPCFGTSKRTRGNAEIISEALGTDFRTVDIKAAVSQHFDDIGHDPKNMDVVYENSQARERTQILMDMANAEGALVIGTGDLSELALGFATYNGDHMSMFGVNGSIPKTLMRAMVRHFAGVFGDRGESEISLALYDIVNTPVSPELLPTDEGGDIAQCTEGIVGPYELHDYFIYYTVKYGLSPREILKLATASFRGVYDEETVKGWLRVFVKRFFSQQFKRSCMPDGVKVTDISLSPRGSFAMPSDVSSTLWLGELDEG